MCFWKKIVIVIIFKCIIYSLAVEVITSVKDFLYMENVRDRLIVNFNIIVILEDVSLYFKKDLFVINTKHAVEILYVFFKFQNLHLEYVHRYYQLMESNH